MSPAGIPALDPVDARALFVLVEKQHTVPDTYPMTLNALLSGCNQKTSRDPVMSLREPELVEAIDRLKARSLVIESSGGRVMRYEQNVRRVIDMPSAALALITVLVLRGPQTSGELRLHSERLHRFADISSVESFLDEMADRDGRPLVVQLARQPGAREARWAHLLCGPVPAGPVTHARVAASGEPGESDPLRRELAATREELARLKQRFDALCAHLGWPDDAV
ncbi:MAG: YceH family protein [Burkholderiaceae bacterium]|nr:YceH family protein [Burkholderiaceae bacterium]